jgi:hypothetical protein
MFSVKNAVGTPCTVLGGDHPPSPVLLNEIQHTPGDGTAQAETGTRQTLLPVMLLLSLRVSLENVTMVAIATDVAMMSNTTRTITVLIVLIDQSS